VNVPPTSVAARIVMVLGMGSYILHPSRRAAAARHGHPTRNRSVIEVGTGNRSAAMPEIDLVTSSALVQALRRGAPVSDRG
jgi:hypothetical protein